MDTYIKEDDKVYLVKKTVVDVKVLEDELASLKEMSEPTDKELIDFAKHVHPYYTGETDDRIESLEGAIAQIKETDEKVLEVK